MSNLVLNSPNRTRYSIYPLASPGVVSGSGREGGLMAGAGIDGGMAVGGPQAAAGTRMAAAGAPSHHRANSGSAEQPLTGKQLI